MKNFAKYLNQLGEIKPNLTREELLELKGLLEKVNPYQKIEELGTRSKECYSREIENKLKNA